MKEVIKEIKNKLLSKKNLSLCFVGLTILALTCGETAAYTVDPIFNVNFDKNSENLSFDEAAALTLRFHNALAVMPPYTASSTQEDLNEWTAEIAPIFESEKIVEKAWFPNVIGFITYKDGDDHEQNRGQTNCDTSLFINERVANKHSTWYQQKDLPMVVAHELAHYGNGPLWCVENRNNDVAIQLSAIEVMSALANKGNKEAFYAVVGEFETMSITSAYGAALRDENITKYEKLIQEVSPGALTRANFDKIQRYWAEKEQELSRIIHDYNARPLIEIQKAEYSQVIENSDSPLGKLVFPKGYIKMDDTIYLLAHLEEMAKAYGEKK